MCTNAKDKLKPGEKIHINLKPEVEPRPRKDQGPEVRVLNKITNQET